MNAPSTGKLDKSTIPTTQDIPEASSIDSAIPKVSFLELIETRHESWFTRPKLKQFLHRFGTYPDKYRPLIWKYLLQVPENQDVHTALMLKGTHIAWKNLRDLYPLKSERSMKAVER